MKRLQSPSSINTYIQCPRKYFYIYNLKLPTKPSIHLIRGSVAHLALENIFTIDPRFIGSVDSMRIILHELLKKYWNENKTKLNSLNMTESELNFYLTETQFMLDNWISQFSQKLLNLGLPFDDGFLKLKPITEKLYKSEELQVRGYIDAIEDFDGIRLMDYKTSKSSHVSAAYKLQLGIYALLYEQEHNVRPDKVGIYFLKDKEVTLDVTDDLILNAKFQIEQIHEATESNNILDYPMKTSPLCKWATGQCDFYNKCFGNGL